MINEEGPFERCQFVLSAELLKLLEWLIDFEQDSLKKLIKRAIQHGFIKQGLRYSANSNPEALQQSIIDFFTIIDIILHESINEDDVRQALKHDLIPALNNFDTNPYDSSSVAMSIHKATAKTHKGKDPKDVLCQELLKRWKPDKQSTIH